MEDVLKEILIEIKSMKSDIGDLKTGQTKMEARLKNVESQLENVGSRLETVEKGQLRLESRLETEVIDRVRILFDAFQSHEGKLDQHAERLDRIESKLDDISTDTRYLVARVAKLEKLAK